MNFQHTGKKLYPLLDSLVLNLSELYNTRGFGFRSQLETALGAAISSIGPEGFLSILPLGLNPSEQ